MLYSYVKVKEIAVNVSQLAFEMNIVLYKNIYANRFIKYKI
jgi:hypothetical protein